MLLVVDMEVIGIDGGGDGGGDKGIVMTLVGRGISGVDVDGIGLCHCRGNSEVVVVGEMGAIVGGAKEMVGGVD